MTARALLLGSTRTVQAEFERLDDPRRRPRTTPEHHPERREGRGLILGGSIGPAMMFGAQYGSDLLFTPGAILDLRLGVPLGSGFTFFGSAIVYGSQVGAAAVGPGLQFRAGHFVVSLATHAGGAKGVQSKAYGLVSIDGEIGYTGNMGPDVQWRLGAQTGASFNFIKGNAPPRYEVYNYVSPAMFGVSWKR
jgi:hypothetical protein